MNRTTTSIVLAVALASALLFAAIRLFGKHPDPAAALALRATPVSDTVAIPVAPLVDTAGQPTTLTASAPATIAFFGYTRCRDTCPVGLATMARARATSGARDMRMVFVTIDPAYDTPAILKRYVAQFDAHILGLTGTPDAIATLEKAFDIQVKPNGGDIVHGDAIYLLGNDRILGLYPPDGPASDLAADERSLKALPAVR
jgi:protein SCO1/2